MESCCELLSNCIFAWKGHNRGRHVWHLRPVVSCFQIVSSPGKATTRTQNGNAGTQLWVAFKLYLRLERPQPSGCAALKLDCCELLSNCIFAWKGHNKVNYRPLSLSVVSCFQIVSSPGKATTVMDINSVLQMLWVAFKLYLRLERPQLSIGSATPLLLLWVAFKLYLRLERPQHHRKGSQSHRGCELLSNCIFAWKGHNSCVK